jgi:flagellar basal-body rod protein FlgG
MIEGLFISASGMLPKTTRHEAIANNLANAEVPGFKRDSMFMREVMEAKKRLSGDYPDWRINRSEGMWTDFDQGKLHQTGNMYSLALNGQGFFAVRTSEGVQYTRNGNFSKDNQGRLVDALGNPVLNSQGDEILIPPSFSAPLIDDGGVIKVRDETQGVDQVVGRLQVVDFPELYDRNLRAQSPFQPVLSKGKQGMYIPQPGTQQVAAQTTKVVQGYLENSNVEPVIEMVKMIDVYRSYEADQKAIQVQDSTLERAVNDVGVVR